MAEMGPRLRRDDGHLRLRISGSGRGFPVMAFHVRDQAIDSAVRQLAKLKADKAFFDELSSDP
jgi:hypothetical protein